MRMAGRSGAGSKGLACLQANAAKAGSASVHGPQDACGAKAPSSGAGALQGIVAPHPRRHSGADGSEAGPVPHVSLGARTRTGTLAEAPILARSTHSPQPASAVATPVETNIETSDAPTALERTPLNGDLVRRRWRSLLGRRPPRSMSLALMDRILIWREQVAEGGDINSRSRAIFAAAFAGMATAAEKDGQLPDNANQRISGAHRHRSFAPVRVGTALTREHAGVLHRVTVVPEGFEWEGRIYASLSAVARAITGVRWNGRRFFALDRKLGQVVSKASERDERARHALRRPNEPLRRGDAT